MKSYFFDHANTLGFHHYIFVLFFSILLLCQLLIGETYIGIFNAALMLTLLGGFFLLNRKDLEFNKLKCFILFAWLFYLTSLIFSTIFSHSIPLSLQHLFFSAFYFIFFTFFLVMPEKFIKKIMIGQLLIIVSVVLVFMSVVTRFNSEWAGRLPGMNIIYETYGHNHIAALIILINPLLLWKHLSDLDQEKKPLNKKTLSEKLYRNRLILLYFLFNLILITTFARVGILIGFIQTIIGFGVSYKKLKKNYSTTIFTKSVLFFLSLIFISILSVKLFFSLVQSFSPTNICPVDILNGKLCKDISKDLRMEYWTQSILAIREYPVWGYGPGTFTLISHRFKSAPYAFAGFAHNAFLQAMAESGVISGLLYILISFFPLYYAWKKIKSSTFFEFGLVIALGAIYFDSLFDFDLSFSGLYLFTLLISAILLRLLNHSEKKSIEFGRAFITGSVIFITLTGLLYGSVYIFLELLISKDVKTAVTIFPYMYYQRNIFFNSQKLEPTEKNKLVRIYRFHSENYANSVYKDLQDQNLLVSIDPWKAVFLFISNTREENRRVFSSPSVTEISEFLLRQPKENQVLSYEQKKIVAENMLQFADELLNQGKHSDAAKLYVSAYNLVLYSIQDHQTVFPNNKESLQTFFNEIETIKAEDFGRQNSLFAHELFTLSSQSLNNNEFDDLLRNYSRIAEISPSELNRYWRSVSEILAKNIEDSLNKNDQTKAKELVKIWSKTREKYIRFDTNIHYQDQERLAMYLVHIANSVTDFEFLLESYRTAVDISPSIFNSTEHFLDKEKPISTENIKQFFDQVSQQPELMGGRKQLTLQLLLTVLPEIFLAGDNQEVEKYLTISKDLNLDGSMAIEKLVVSLQSLVEQYLEKNEYEKALKLTQLMSLLTPTDYWVVQQPGNLLLTLGKTEQMEEEYNKCLQVYPNHDECLHNGWGDAEKFMKVGQIIKGEKTVEQVFPKNHD